MSCNLIRNITVTNSVLTDTDVPENDHAAWNISTAYTAGQRVIHEHGIYVLAVNDTGTEPGTDPAIWVYEQPTNRYRAFSQPITNLCSQADSMFFEVTLPSGADAIAFFGLAADSVRVRVMNPTGDDTVADGYDRTIDLVGTSVWGGTNPCWDMCTIEPAYMTKALYVGFAGVKTRRLWIDITATGGTPAVGLIDFGKAVNLGTALEGTTPGYLSFSSVTRSDIDGSASLTSGGWADRVTFDFDVRQGDEARVVREVAGRSGVWTTFYTTEADVVRGTLINGVPGNVDFPLVGSGNGPSQASLPVEGVS